MLHAIIRKHEIGQFLNQCFDEINVWFGRNGVCDVAIKCVVVIHVDNVDGGPATRNKPDFEINRQSLSSLAFVLMNTDMGIDDNG